MNNLSDCQNNEPKAIESASPQKSKRLSLKLTNVTKQSRQT